MKMIGAVPQTSKRFARSAGSASAAQRSATLYLLSAIKMYVNDTCHYAAPVSRIFAVYDNFAVVYTGKRISNKKD